MPEGKLKFWR